MRWLLVFLIASLVFSAFSGWLRRIGLGRLPGDFTLTIRGKPVHIPLASSLLLSFLATLIGSLI
jgi:hypothetical protein